MELHWEQWDLSKDDPPFYPESGEPEDYVESLPHSPETADLLGNIWEIIFRKRIEFNVYPNEEKSWIPITRVSKMNWDGSDFFGCWGKNSRYVPVVTDQGREFFLEHVSEWVTFKELPSE